MTNFTEKQIQGMLAELKDEFGSDIATRELALLELEDMKRKGCALEYSCKFDQCRACSISAKCPVIDWHNRHPEYANDELAIRIKYSKLVVKKLIKLSLKLVKRLRRKLKKRPC